MRNAWLPVVTVIGLQVGGLLAGAVLTETVFAWNGRRPLGRRGDPGPRLPRGPVGDPDLRAHLPGREPGRRYRLRLPQPADPVLLMATRRGRRSPARRPGPSRAGCGGTPSAACCATGRRCSAWLHHRIFVGVAVLAPLIAPYDPMAAHLARHGFKPPTPAHLMGTDLQGRDDAQPGPLRRPDQPRSSASSSVVMGADHRAARSGPLAGGVRRPGRHRPDADHRRPAGDPGHPAGDRHRRLARSRPAPDHVGGRADRTSRSSPACCAGSLLALRESDYVIAARSVGASTPRILLRHMLPERAHAAHRGGDARPGDRDHRRRRARLPRASARPTRGSPSGGRC